MHPNPIFHDADTQQNLEFARERGFGVLALNGPEAPLVSHVPFLIDEGGHVVDLHLVRSNPIVRVAKEPVAARIVMSGGDSYVSPDWYEVPDQVPTWNYVAIHLTGVLEQRPAEELRDLLDRQSAYYEDRLLPKPPWSTGKMAPQTLDKMMRMIVPFRMRITKIEGTWKLSQNKPDAVRLSASEEVAAYGFGQETRILSAMMQGVAPKDK